MPATVPSFRVLPDHFCDLIHQVSILLDGWADKVCLSGSFSLNAFGSINRTVSDIDICILTDVYDESIALLREKIGVWFDSEIDDSKTTRTGYNRFRLIANDGSKLCVFRHQSFPDNLVRLNMHGQIVQLFPPSEIIRYKMISLNASLENSSNVTLDVIQLKKHIGDVLSYANRTRSVPMSTLSSIDKLADLVNKYCRTRGIPLICEYSQMGGKVSLTSN